MQASRDTKSVSAERTFETNLTELADILQEIERIAKMSFERYQRTGEKGVTMTLKIKYGDFQQITRSHTYDEVVTDEEAYLENARNLMHEGLLRDEGIRLLGVGISNFRKEEKKTESTQLTMGF